MIGYTSMGPTAAAAETSRVLSLIPRPPIVLSAGVCGGLRAGLSVGTVVIPDEVVGPDGRRWPCAVIGLPQSGRLLTADHIVGTPDEKRRLHQAHRADIVDMEAAAVAEVCQARGVPFAAVKSVCDPADVALPAELADIAPDGRVRGGRLLAAVARRPSLVRELMRLDRDSRRAARVVCERVRELLPPSQGGG